MKKLFTFSFLILIALQATTQSLVRDSRPVQRSVMAPSSEGKYNVYTFYSAQESNPSMQFSRGYSDKILGPGDGSHRSSDIQTFHVAFHFDLPLSSFFCIGSGMMYSNYSNLYMINDTTLEGDLLEGYYYTVTEFLVFNTSTDFFTIYDVLQNGFHVYQDMDTTILSSTADHLLAWNMIDENAAEIPASNKAGNDLGFYYTFPDTIYTPSLCFFYLAPIDKIKINDLQPGMQLRLTKTAVEDNSITDDGLYHQYVINYPFITELQHDTLLANNPMEYGIFPHVLHNSPSFMEGYLGFGFGVMQNPMLYDFFVMSSIVQTLDYPKEGSDTCVLFQSGTTDPSDMIFFVTYLNSCERKPITIEASKYNMYSSFRYLSPEGDLIHSEGLYYPPSSFDYRIPDGMPVDFGNNAPYIQTFGQNAQNNNELTLYVNSLGQVLETRNMDFMTGSYDIWQGSQYIGSGPITEGQIHRWVDYPAEYTVTVDDSNYRILGKTGIVHSDITVDLQAADPNPPSMTFFRILQGDRISQELIRGFESSLWLRAGDIPPGMSHFEPPASAQAYYKRSYDTTWMELVLTPMTSLFDPLLGMPYTADLAPALNQYPDSAWVDIRLEITDPDGNSVVNTFSPAFLVRDKEVGTGPGVSRNAIAFYPNPACDLVTITGTRGHAEVTLYSIIGERVLHTLTDRTVNISALPGGLYLISLKDLTTGDISTGKLAIVR